ncbi:hypothetical protein EJ110_NYTH19756 [Nymphaea thermarum]|nr:hypothetical protein EJ110_NYTH19756 [Nymphaea thermarum]
MNRRRTLDTIIEAPVHSSNVMLYSKEKQVASRVGHKILEDGTRVRYLLKTGEVIDSSEQWKRVVKDMTKNESSGEVIDSSEQWKRVVAHR